MHRMRVLVEEVVQMFPHVVRRLFVELLPFRRGDLHELVICRDMMSCMSVKRPMTCVESTSELGYQRRVDSVDTLRHRADAVIGTASRRWRGAPKI